MHDPLVREFERPFTSDMDEVLKDADALMLITSHREYADIDLNTLKNTMKGNVLIDGRNFLDEKAAGVAGFQYRCVGKGK